MFPRAPELTIMKTGFIFGKLASMARATSAVALVQISISSWRRSSSVMTPRWNCFSIFSASFSCLSRIAPFSGGVTTSSIAIVTPARVAQ
jgi:hypothetical protein